MTANIVMCFKLATLSANHQNTLAQNIQDQRITRIGDLFFPPRTKPLPEENVFFLASKNIFR